MIQNDSKDCVGKSQSVLSIFDLLKALRYLRKQNILSNLFVFKKILFKLTCICKSFLMTTTLSPTTVSKKQLK